MAYFFVSDLHLDAAQPQTVDRFVNFLQRGLDQARALYILGDLFESWLGDDLLDATQTRVCGALRSLSRAGTALFVMRGNRDFLFDDKFAELTGALLLPDPVRVELDGLRILLTHGDLLCTDDVNYQQLRSLAHDAGWRDGLRRLSTTTRRRLAALARAGSRRHMAQAQPNIMDVSAATVQAVLRGTAVDLIIHGHTHRPGVHAYDIDGRTPRRAVLDAWYEAGHCLRLANGELTALRLD